MRRYRQTKLDANQKQIVDVLRKSGATVCDLSSVGGGCPDLLVGFRGENYLLEVKNPHGRNRHEHSQQDWAVRWTGQYAIVTSVDETLDWLARQRTGARRTRPGVYVSERSTSVFANPNT